MYKMRLVDNTKDEEIIDFENRRYKGFGVNQIVNDIKKSAFGRVIKSGNSLAFNCLDEDDNIIGGMLISTMFGDVYLDRLFVDCEERGKGAGKYMVKYLLDNQKYFDDYFGCDSSVLLVEPTDKTVDFYSNLGFHHSGYQMYKRY